MNRYNGAARGRIVGSIYRGNIIEYELMIGNRMLKVQANTGELFEIGEEVFFNFRRAIAIGNYPNYGICKWKEDFQMDSRGYS